MTPVKSYLENIEKIGSGSYSQVYKCYYSPDLRYYPKEVCAVKYVRSDYNGVSCINELVVMSVFNHANIMTAKNIWYDVIDDAPTMVIVMDLAECSLENYRSNLDEIGNVVRSILCGLKVLHDAGFIHGDLKPSNILKCKTGYKITDFSIVSTNVIKNHGRICTYPYRPPEAFDSSRWWNEKVDIWALGTTLFELVFAKRLFPIQNGCKGNESGIEPLMLNAIADWANDTGQKHSIIKSDVEYSSYYRSSRFFGDSRFSDVADFILQCCRVNPEERPTAAELLSHRFIKSPPPDLIYDIVQYSEISLLDERAWELIVNHGKHYSLPALIIAYAAQIVMIVQAMTSRYEVELLVKVAFLLALKVFSHSQRKKFCQDNGNIELYQGEIDVLSRLRFILPIPRSIE